MKAYRKYLPLLALLLLLPLVAGCGGRSATPLPSGQYETVRVTLMNLDTLKQSDLLARDQQLDTQIKDGSQPRPTDGVWESLGALLGHPPTKAPESELAFLKLQRGYVKERLAGQPGQVGLLNDAVSWYRQADSVYSSVSILRIAQVSEYQLNQEKENPDQAQQYRTNVVRALEQLNFSQANAKSFIRDPAVGFLPPGRPARNGWR